MSFEGSESENDGPEEEAKRKTGQYQMDDNDFSDEEDKPKKVQSAKTKAWTKLQLHSIDFVNHAKNHQFIDCREDLAQINTLLKVPQHAKYFDGVIFPKWFVKHVGNTLQEIQNFGKEESDKLIKEEGVELKKLKRTELHKFGAEQIELFRKDTSFWSDQKSDFEMEGEVEEYDEEEEDEDAGGEEEEEDEEKKQKKEDKKGAQTKKDEEEEEEEEPQEDDEEEEDEEARAKAEEEEEEEEEEDKEEDEDQERDVLGDADEDVDEDEDEDEDEIGQGKAKRKDKDVDDVEWDESSSHHESDTEHNEVPQRASTTEGDIGVFGEALLAQMKQRSFWVKGKGPAQTTKRRRKRPEKPDKSEKPEKPEKPAAESKEEEAKTEDKEHVQQWPVKMIQREFADALKMRGKTGVDRNEVVEKLKKVAEQCKLANSQQAYLTINSILVSFYFDSASRKQAGMSGSRWKIVYKLVKDIIKALIEHFKALRMSPFAELNLNFAKTEEKEVKQEDDKQLKFLAALRGQVGLAEHAPVAKVEAQPVIMSLDMDKHEQLDPKYEWVHGNLWSYVKRLREQLWTNLKTIPYLTEEGAAYQSRLQDTPAMIALLKEAYKYFEMLGDKRTMAEIDTTRLSLIYTQYQEKYDALNKQIHEEERMLVAKPSNTLFKFGGEEILHLPNNDVTKFAKFVFEHGDTRLQTEAMLYLIFNMALHNRFELCRDLLLMSHLGSQTRIGTANVDLQILYNRALVQFALAAFIQGKWHPCMLILQEFYQSSKIRILLAQAVPPIRDRDVLTSEQIKQEALALQRLLPPHLYFRPDTLEAVHLISSILLEIPSMVTGSRKAIKNKYFRNRVWDPYLKRDLRVPPEGTQSSILTAGIYLQDGNWQECAALLKSLRLWSDLKHADYVQGKVLNSVKHECMRCYLHRFGTVYESISINKLAAMFELSEAETKQYVCRMIISNSEDRFRASVDELTNCIIIHQKPATALQRIALEYTNKLAFLIEQNEKSIGIRRFDHLNVGAGANAQRFKRTGYSGPRTDRRGPEGQERQGQPGQERQAGQTQGQGQRGQFIRKGGGQAPQRRPIFMRT